jgi:tetratricopeptide (TPR) repeat protein
VDLRAFVIMPFHTREVGAPGTATKTVDFDAVYEHLLKPALKLAGCEAFRGDYESSAGDIRTDMFFELVTADVVIADVSSLNANVFYELGVRDGVCPRGVFLVRGNWTGAQPFDIAPDRAITYDGRFYETGQLKVPPPPEEVEKLAHRLKAAIQMDQQAVGSPVYSHLPGLRAPDCSEIQTSRARHFARLRDDWLDRVRVAQSHNRPGHILTLADDAPTRMHRSQILLEAATALIGLCRYRAAEPVLREVLSINPDNKDARLHLATVLEQLDRTVEAEDELRSMLHMNEDDGPANRHLGHVYRYLWRLTWQKHKNDLKAAVETARNNSALAASAFSSFCRAHELDLGSYFSGFNAVLLDAIVKHLFSGAPPDEFRHRPIVDLIAVVRHNAECTRRRALALGQHDEHFWSTTTLSGLALLCGEKQRALQLLRDACTYPQTTPFQREHLKFRLELLQELGFEPKFAVDAIGIVREGLHRPAGYKKVVLFVIPTQLQRGQELDLAAHDHALLSEITRQLEDWGIDKHALMICGGLQPAQLVAKTCNERGATMRLLLSRPSALPDFDAEVWWHDDELGAPLDQSSLNARHNRWLLNTATMEAQSSENAQLYGLIVRDPAAKAGNQDYAEQSDFFINGIGNCRNPPGIVQLIPIEHAGS